MEISNGGEGAAYITTAEYDKVQDVIAFDIPDRVWGDMIKIYMQGQDKVLVMSEVEVYGIEEWYDEKAEKDLAIRNIAKKGIATQSSNYGEEYDAKNAIDGSVNGRMSMTKDAKHPWWQVVFDKRWKFSKLYVNVKDASVDMTSFEVAIFRNNEMVYYKNVNAEGGFRDYYLIDLNGTIGDWVRIFHNAGSKKKAVELNEVEVWGRDVILGED